jgi:hypothetical protein
MHPHKRNWHQIIWMYITKYIVTECLCNFPKGIFLDEDCTPLLLSMNWNRRKCFVIGLHLFSNTMTSILKHTSNLMVLFQSVFEGANLPKVQVRRMKPPSSVEDKNGWSFTSFSIVCRDGIIIRHKDNATSYFAFINCYSLLCVNIAHLNTHYCQNKYVSLL